MPFVWFVVVVQSLNHVWLLLPHGLWHARLPCLSLCPGVCSKSCPLSHGHEWCHPTISSSVTPFSSCPQSFLASGSFPMSWVFASGGQIIGASAPVLPMNIQGWYPLGWTHLISLQSNGLSRSLLQPCNSKASVFSVQPSLCSFFMLEHICTWLFGPLLAKWCLCFLIHCHGLS